MLLLHQSLSRYFYTMAAEMREGYRKNEIKYFMRIRGGVSCDGLKEFDTGQKYCNMIVHHFKFRKVPCFSPSDFQMQYVSNVLFIKQHRGEECSAALRASLHKQLERHLGASFEELMENCSFFTDCNSNMPVIEGVILPLVYALLTSDGFAAFHINLIRVSNTSCSASKRELEGLGCLGTCQNDP